MTGEVGMDRNFDVVIVGAGPAGCTCALTLKDAGLRVALLEKSEFPRDKVCGESLNLKGFKALRAIGPEIAQAFNDYPDKNRMNHSIIHYKQRILKFDWVLESYIVRRLEFDQFMLSMVGRFTKTEVFTGISIEHIEKDANGVTVKVKNGSPFTAAIIVGSDGANSVVAKQLAQKVLDRQHYFGAVRAYFKNVDGTQTGDTTQTWFNTKYDFNYLWIFPINKEISNVGFGMLSSDIARNKVNLKEVFYEFIQDSPELAAKFKHAEQVGTLDGFGVPLGSSLGTLSGERFMLTGDAGSLSNPVSGTGMGNAIVSGKLAAEQAMRCFKSKDFGADHMKRYDDNVQKAIIDDLMKTYKWQKFVARLPFSMDIVFALGQIKFIRTIIQGIV